jgi:divalent metal cation (Fe/Co/Zn/Cd) transporter
VLEGHPSVERLIALRTQHVGPDAIIVNAKVEFDSTLTMVRLAEVVNELEHDLRDAEPKALTIFIEPDIFRAPAAAG